MTQEEKELLLKDLCARLPYGVICDIGLKHPLQLQRIFVDRLDGILLDFYEDGNNYQVYLSEVKPYLLPLSSMNEEQHKEFYDRYCWNDGGDNFEMDSCSHYYALEKFDWLNKNHFDYRGLIHMGLAIDATGLNIY